MKKKIKIEKKNKMKKKIKILNIKIHQKKKERMTGLNHLEIKKLQ